jgi:hypothetical protein
VGHHRFKITFAMAGEMKESANEAASKVPSDDKVKDELMKRVRGLDVGEGFKITDITVASYSKTPIP